MNVLRKIASKAFRLFVEEKPRAQLICPHGFLDRALHNGEVLTVEGWALGHELGQLKELKIWLDGSLLQIHKAELSLPSVDVFNVLKQEGSERCRYRATALLPSGKTIKNSLVQVQLYFERGPGRIYFRPLELTLPIPGDDLIEGIGGGFLDVACEYLSHFVTFGKLKSTDNVLDIGCGCGRMAYPLSLYLSKESMYRGFDIVPDQIEWAKNTIGSENPRFEFERVDIFNKYYNPTGTLKSDSFHFPYTSSSFQFCFLTSVFTHMLEADVKHYLKEIARVLESGGRCLMTCFLLNAESKKMISQGQSRVIFVDMIGNAHIADRKKPEGAVGFEQSLFYSWIEEAGLKLENFYPGSWCGRDHHYDYQDMLVVVKP